VEVGGIMGVVLRGRNEDGRVFVGRVSDFEMFGILSKSEVLQ
jgi:hypothetical protein